MAYPEEQIAGTFGATGQSASIVGKSIDVSLSGAASATVGIQRRINGVWVTIESITGDGERVVENAASTEHRLNCSAYTSGTVVYAMRAGTR